MKRLFHKLFRKHKFEPFELIEDHIPITHTGTNPKISDDPATPLVWYVGYVCSCGEPGYMVGPIDV